MNFTARQEDALREVLHLGSAQAATTLSRLTGPGGILVDVPVVLEANRWQLAWLLGGRDVSVAAVTFGVDGALHGQMWWVLPAADARVMAQRLLDNTRTSTSAPMGESAAILEAGNIVASVCLSAIGTFVHAQVTPSTPQLLETAVAALVGAPQAEPTRCVMSASFTTTHGPRFSGRLVLLLDDESVELIVRRLGV